MSEITLIEKIKQDAAAEAAAIKAEGDATVEAFKRETDTLVEARKKALTAALKKELAQTELVAVSKAKQAAKLAIQTAKREEMDALFTTVAKEIAEAPAAEYIAFFTKYAANIVPSEVQVTRVIAPAARETETIDIVKQLGLSGEVVTDDTIVAGFILEVADGVYDVTLTRLMSEHRAELEMEIAKRVTS